MSIGLLASKLNCYLFHFDGSHQTLDRYLKLFVFFFVQIVYFHNFLPSLLFSPPTHMFAGKIPFMFFYLKIL